VTVRKIPHAYQRVRNHNFSISGLEGFDICGKTIGSFTFFFLLRTRARTHARTQTHAHTHTHTLSLSLSLARALSLFLRPSNSLSCSVLDFVRCV